MNPIPNHSATPKLIRMWPRTSCTPKLIRYTWPGISSLVSLLHVFILQASLFWLELAYFVLISLIGFVSLKASRTRLVVPTKNIDLFFTSVSATTVSSMSAVDMEVFSNLQLVFMTIMMFVGGEVFTSILELPLMKAKMSRNNKGLIQHRMDSHTTESNSGSCDHSIELGNIGEAKLDVITLPGLQTESSVDDNLKLDLIKSLSFLVSAYLLVVHLAGSTAISLYITLIPSAHRVLTQKGLSTQIFPIFTTVSSFANCGFIPTNENMIVFKKNSGLLLIIIAQILMGNTLYPVCLRLLIWTTEWFTKKKEFKYMLEKSKELGYDHLLPGTRCLYLGFTGLGFIVLQLVVFCLMEWKSKVTDGLNGYQKLVGSLFQVVNSRHAGELVFDLSAISSAVLVMFVFMMYLPPYTSYLPLDDDSLTTADTQQTINTIKPRKDNRGFCKNMLFSQLTYLTIFVILICITERHAIKTDPLNFSVLNIVFEVISAYGNVGLSVGYSCGRQISPDGHCKDASYGFSGRWSNEGKLVLIAVMFFGRLKKFSRRGGRAWSLQ